MFLAPNLRNLCIRFWSQCFRFAQRRKQPPCELGEQLYASIPQAVIPTRLFSMEENWPFCNCGFGIGAILTFHFLLLNLFESAEPKFFTKFLFREGNFGFNKLVPKKNFATRKLYQTGLCINYLHQYKKKRSLLSIHLAVCFKSIHTRFLLVWIGPYLETIHNKLVNKWDNLSDCPICCQL